MPVIPALVSWRQKDQGFKVMHSKFEVLFFKKGKTTTKQKQEAGEEGSVGKRI